MNILIAYDAGQVIDRAAARLFNAGDRIYLYPLTSRSSITDRLAENIRSRGCISETLQTARLLNDAAHTIRDEYLRFIADVPDKIVYKGKNLKEAFAIDGFATLWWSSPISEKSTFKSPAFNNLAQLDAIIKTISDKKIERIVWDCKNDPLREALGTYALKKSIRFEAISPQRLPVTGGFKKYAGAVLYLFRHAFRLFLRAYRIKKTVSRAKRSAVPSDNLMIITAYPNIDVAAAKKGIFRNKFYPFLQDELEKKGQGIIWACMYVENNFVSFKEALQYARSFISNGYNLYFLEEFISPLAQLRALFLMLKSGLRYLRMERDIEKLHSFGEYNFYPLFRDDWYTSFMNYMGYEGILRYELFRVLLSRLNVRKCLYMCEMQGWEKSLETAKKSLRSETALFAYQHGSIARMCMSYFSHPSEIRTDVRYARGVPDAILCNGEVSYSYIKESGWPMDRIRLVDAIRYNHLKGPLRSNPVEKKNALLMALSLSLQESSALLTMAWEAFRDIKDVEIWLKPHPFIRVIKIFELAGLAEGSSFFHIKNEPLNELLSEARVVIAGESSVSFEALAHGCEVLVVNTCEWINMSPLDGIASSTVSHVDSAEGLREKVNDIFQRPYERERFSKEAKKVIYQNFCLNDETDVPELFLEALEGSKI